MQANCTRIKSFYCFLLSLLVFFVYVDKKKGSFSLSVAANVSIICTFVWADEVLIVTKTTCSHWATDMSVRNFGIPSIGRLLLPAFCLVSVVHADMACHAILSPELRVEISFRISLHLVSCCLVGVLFADFFNRNSLRFSFVSLS